MVQTMWNFCFSPEVIRNTEGANVWVIKLLLSLVNRQEGSMNLSGSWSQGGFLDEEL